MGADTVPTYCPLCVSRCGARAEVRDGTFLALHPDPSHPTGKAICVKGKAAPDDRRTTGRGSSTRCGGRGPRMPRIRGGSESPGTRRWTRLRSRLRTAPPRRARVGGIQLELALHIGDQRRGRLGSAADPCVREPELLQLHGTVRVGQIPRAALHVRRVRARRLSAGPRERRVHPVLGIQPVRGPSRPRDEHRRRGRARRQADRRRPAQGRPRRQGRPLAAGSARAPTRRSPSPSRT